MKSLYASPLRVYLCLIVLAIVGIFSGFSLPISLFPNSSKPSVSVNISYGNSTADEFSREYGNQIESQLHTLRTDQVEVEKVTASYDQRDVTYGVEFKWGSPAKAALREVESVTNAMGARFPREVRDSVGIWSHSADSGFLAVSFYSPTRSLDEVHDLLEPLIMPQISKVKDADAPELWNPSQKEVRVELNPDRMATLGLFPKDVEAAIQSSLSSYAGGSVTVGIQQLTVQMPRSVQVLDDLSRVLIPTPGGRMVHLSDVARIDFGIKTSGTHIAKTSGVSSLMLWVTPRAGGNVKRMSEEILEIVQAASPSFPKDIQYRVIVDPSEFIRNSIHNVFHEVGLGALLAVAVLFLFLGSLRNTITAAIEIPLSMVLAFILMRMSGMNLNLISLGGLALSAGMNVDASVVVMENIFRHFEALEPGTPIDFKRKLAIITSAVTEVRFSVIASTIASLVVFLPLAFTSDLSYAILGDLAKTVVFSHGFSAFVALILVPTVRLHLMAKSPVVERPAHSPIEGHIRRLENGYGRALGRFIASSRLQWVTYGGIALTLALLFTLVLPRLPKEILGTPDTDMMMLSVRAKGNTLVRQMETVSDEVEGHLLSKFGDRIQYTLTQINQPNSAWIMARLKNKAEMRQLWKDLEGEFTNTPLLKFQVMPWNPAELPIPNPPQLRVVVRGSTLADRAEVARQIESLLEEKQVFPRIWAEPEVNRLENIVLRPSQEQWAALRDQRSSIHAGDVADLARVATLGRKVGTVSFDAKTTDVFLRYPEGSVPTAEDLGALPIGVGAKIIPLKALASVRVEDVPPLMYREDERELFAIFGRKKEGDSTSTVNRAVDQARTLVEDWKQKAHSKASVYFEDAQADLHDALRQLGIAVALSIALIFLTLVVQFGDFANAALVLVAVPLGMIGVMLSLFVFQSTLSLNSVLGVILLNGIAVANSIILVDFMKRLIDRGMPPAQAAVEAGKKRLRPILITSLTTILGMLPIALGMGEGGRILQPLGIAVSGGLWVSMGLTLFVVPALQVSYTLTLSRRSRIWRGKSFENKMSSPRRSEFRDFDVGRLGNRSSDFRDSSVLVSGAIVADEVAAEAKAEGALHRDQVSKTERSTFQ